ncbi:MAG: hypothetical protein RDU20_22140 [Desulfomonilaceae bacterium]|nr:hypothetical protein [Desulfomonilaceae bacterium]
MLNLLENLLGLTATVLGYLLDWPFLLFVFLVWLASRYRDQLGSALDRRAAIKRSELASAVRDELGPITKDLGGLKPDVAELKTRTAKIEALQSEYASERILKPINSRVEALEESLRQLQTQVDRIADVDRRDEIADRLASVDSDVQDLRGTVDRLEQELRPLKEETAGVKETLEEISVRSKPLDGALQSFDKRVKSLESRVDEAPSADEIRRLDDDMERLGEELSGVTVSFALLKAKVEKPVDGEGAPARSAREDGNSGHLKDADLIPLRVMKDALASTRWEWRRVKKLAGIAGLTEDKALQMLENDPDLMVKKDDWGRRIAKLLTK